jgi:hypothetical protein
LKVPKIREEITKYSFKDRDKIKTYPSEITSKLLEEKKLRRLKNSNQQI